MAMSSPSLENVWHKIMSKKSERIITGILLAVAVLTAVKILLVGFDIDEQYAFALSYRLLKGDFLLKEMWEPHQTSAFFLSLIMLPYYRLAGTEGIVLYSRIVSLVIHCGIMFFLWSYLKKKISSIAALCTTVVVFFSLPKIMFLAEFSNVLMWFLLLGILSLLWYYDGAKDGKRNRLFLVLAGIGLIFCVMAYPSMLLLLIVYIIVLLHGRESAGGFAADLFCILLPCIVAGGIMAFILLSKISPAEMTGYAQNVLQDGSHSASVADKLLLHLDSVRTIAVFLGIYLVVSVPLTFLLRVKIKEEKTVHLFLVSLGFVTLTGQLVIWIFFRKYPNYPLVEYFFVPVALLMLLFINKAKVTKEVLLWFVTPVTAFLAVCILSNHPFLVSAPFLAYTIIGLVVISSEYKWYSAEKICRALLVFWAFVICVGHLYLIRVTGGEHFTVLDHPAFIRSGPAKGILADPGTVWNYSEHTTLAADNIPKGSRVLYMGSDNILYLAGDYEVCAANVISTPTYNDLLLKYYEVNPDKKPEYIICDRAYLQNCVELFGTEEYSEIASNDLSLVLK